MSHLSQTSVVALLSLLLASCSVVAEERSYANEAAGLTLKYDSTWTVVQQAELKKALESIDREDIPEEGVSEVIPKIVFSIAKTEKSDSVVHTSNLMLMVIAFPTGSCTELNSKKFLEEEASEYVESLPGAQFAPQSDIPVRGVRTYTVTIPLADRVVTQHRYLYCISDQYVVMQTTSSIPAGEKDLQKVLRTVQVQTPAANRNPSIPTPINQH